MFCTHVPLFPLTYQLLTVHQTTVTFQLSASSHPLRLGERFLKEYKISPSDSYFVDGYVIGYKVGVSQQSIEQH